MDGNAAHPGGPGDGGRLPVIRKTPRLGTTTLQTTVCEATAIDDQSAARFRRLTRCGRSCARAQSPMASPAPMAAAAQGSGEAVQAASTTSPSDAPRHASSKPSDCRRQWWPAGQRSKQQSQSRSHGGGLSSQLLSSSQRCSACRAPAPASTPPPAPAAAAAAPAAASTSPPLYLGSPRLYLGSPRSSLRLSRSSRERISPGRPCLQCVHESAQRDSMKLGFASHSPVAAQPAQLSSWLAQLPAT
eukprot:CAMPEP_0196674398 /NCGR_PEP_ID=MMETSP1090-20130531/3491_1 /TAXON_ID=37098 /ORGANISM="Isochrysis sp, Strain CCMP1244" /LENGTH=244 /DNA_ID=CAMNT_0042012201 /DNA_START=49 /DNA_END=784 /DNA_ORIENTATION=+